MHRTRDAQESGSLAPRAAVLTEVKFEPFLTGKSGDYELFILAIYFQMSLDGTGTLLFVFLRWFLASVKIFDLELSPSREHNSRGTLYRLIISYSPSTVFNSCLR